MQISSNTAQTSSHPSQTDDLPPRCIEADLLRMLWYNENPMWKYDLFAHQEACLRCQRRIRVLTRLAGQAEMPAMEN